MEMEVTPIEVTIRDLVKGYKDKGDSGGVVGYDGKLDIRPPYQREFVYTGDKRDAVIDTIRNGYPLNVMYWGVREDGNFEIIDGQQRTISICQYVDGVFSIRGLGFHNLQDDEQEKILDYELMVYLCKGTDSKKLKWFEIVNIAGEKLEAQELRNAVYHGSWVTEAKKDFSRRSGSAYGLGNKYLAGKVERQDYLATVIKWISDDNSKNYDANIKEYMSKNQHNENADELWEYFEKVIDWVKGVYPKYRKEMKGIDWGFLYNKYKEQNFDVGKLEKQVTKLMKDDDVTNRKGIYIYLLTGDEKHLNIRAFSDNDKRQAYERQEGICPICKDVFLIEGMEADHITPWCEGGKTVIENCQMLCKECNRRKSNR